MLCHVALEIQIVEQRSTATVRGTTFICTLVPLWFIIISLGFFYICKVLFSVLNFKVILSMLKIVQDTATVPL